MKFAVAALIATTSAISIRSTAQGPQCVIKKQSNATFEKLDTDNSGSLSYGEIEVGLQDLAEKLEYQPTDEDWKWAQAEGVKIDTKNPGTVNKKEFYKYANAVFKHFGICSVAVDARQQGPDCVTKDQSKEAFAALDTDNSGSLSYGEIGVGLEDLAGAFDYKPTDADQQWAKDEAKRIDTKNPGKVNEGEFHKFANAVLKHFGICSAAREDRK